jgi:hypothetical protein
VFGLAFGLGITNNIADAYQFLMRTYEDGDRIYLFGFSRGAYTVRAVAAMLHKCGLLDTRDDNLIPYALKMFKYERRPRIYIGFRQTFSRECQVHFMGIWDTVKSIGWIFDPLNLQFTAENPIVRTVRHALSIDERRCFYRPNLWKEPQQDQDVKQVWFAGVHSDVGGSYPEKESGLSQITLQWIVEEAVKCGLVVVPDVEYQPPPDFKGPIHRSLKGLWWIPEVIPKIYYDPRDKYKRKLMIPLGRRRWIGRKSLIHESVIQRMNDPNMSYAPPNLPKEHEVERSAKHAK